MVMRILRLVRRATRSLWENAYLNSVATGVIAASLLLIGVYLTVQFNLNRLVDTWDRDVHVSAYFHDDVPEQRRFDLRDQLANRPEVVRVRYVSPEDAQQWMRQRMPGMDAVLEELGAEALPASLEISLTSTAARPKPISDFAQSLSLEAFTDVDYGQEWMERFHGFLSLLQLLGAIMGSLILMAAIFLVMNTVHLIVYNRKDELEIQKLVGATNGFILAPFLIEGLFQGLIGGILSIAGLFAIHNLLVVRLKESLELAASADLSFLPTTYLLSILLAGALTGVLASFAAVQRFLVKVT
jgi:cell division transport system permease protein